MNFYRLYLLFLLRIFLCQCCLFYNLEQDFLFIPNYCFAKLLKSLVILFTCLLLIFSQKIVLGILCVVFHITTSKKMLERMSIATVHGPCLNKQVHNETFIWIDDHLFGRLIPTNEHLIGRCMPMIEHLIGSSHFIFVCAFVYVFFCHEWKIYWFDYEVFYFFIFIKSKAFSFYFHFHHQFVVYIINWNMCSIAYVAHGDDGKQEEEGEVH